jgi:formylglycine-generating enzyme required for sulfatase activity
VIDLGFVVIPAGEFLMGSRPRQDRYANDDEVPQHRLMVTQYHIMRTPVTVAQYREFLEATGWRTPLTWPTPDALAARAAHPVVGVSLHDALAFARWAAELTGLPVRLPTEPEWEKAARGPDGRLYPWGDAWDPARSQNRECRAKDTSPVGQFSPHGDSAYGIVDMAGNVQTWCGSFFGAYPYDAGDGREALTSDPALQSLFPAISETGAIANPARPEATQGKHVVRGGSWHGSREQSRCAYRSWAAPMHRSDDTGIRLAYE